MFISRLLTSMIGLSLIAVMLSACTMGGAAVSGAQAVYNRNGLKKNFDDSYTSMKAYKAIYMDTHRYENCNVSVATLNDDVLIAGQIPSLLKKYEIKYIVKKLAGNRKVHDYTEIANPSSTLTRTSDSWITSKIKAQLIAANDVDPSKIKVVTENGTVYLMGTVLRDEAEIAVQIAQDTSGVQNVVKLFSYMTISRT